jgi:hypothetical protein
MKDEYAFCERKVGLSRMLFENNILIISKCLVDRLGKFVA